MREGERGRGGEDGKRTREREKEDKVGYGKEGGEREGERELCRVYQLAFCDPQQ